MLSVMQQVIIDTIYHDHKSHLFHENPHSSRKHECSEYSTVV
nr:MAG TPA: hypothetical protein [Caudoviricetes sp.]